MIRAVHAEQRLDSRGKPAVQVDLATEDGTFRSLAPHGEGKGKYEVAELRDGDESYYEGLGVEKAVRNVRGVIGPALIERQFNCATQLREIDDYMAELDGTPRLSNLGGNAILAVSMSCARAGAAAAKLPLYEFLRRESHISGHYILPVPFFNVINGGLHSGDTMAFQEIMSAPTGAKSFAEAMRMGSDIHHRLKEIISRKFGPLHLGIGVEGGFTPHIRRPEEGFEILEDAVAQCGYQDKTKFALHAASPAFFRTSDGTYDMGFPDKETKLFSPQEMQQLYQGFVTNYAIVLLEDPFEEDDWDSWAELNKVCDIEIVGDALLTTNIDRMKLAHERNSCNSLLLKINQVGTISKALDAARLAYSYGWSVFVSHRAGDTTDDFVADLAVAINAGHLKSGAPFGGERNAKYNRVLDIESELKASRIPHAYAGHSFRHSGCR